MADEIRYARKCFYASAEYAESFWGQYIYLYEGEGGLRLTSDSLRLEDCPGAVEIPFHAIKGIGLGRFSTWAKPFGLSRLTVRYVQDGEPRAIHLVPYESIWSPTPETSLVVAGWLETLGRVEGLANLVESPPLAPSGPHSAGKTLSAATRIALLSTAILVTALVGWLVLQR